MANKKISAGIKDQVFVFHEQIVELIKKYQFRDRDQILPCGISVSQCYILETLHTHGPLTVGALADKMYLKISTITRVVDQLVKKGYVVREQDTNDGRVFYNKMTAQGEKVYLESWENIFISEKAILDNFDPDQKDLLIDFLKKLNQSVSEWHSTCKIK